MKEYKIIYLKETTTPDNPDLGYRKLYPKDDGWYMLDSDGNEIRIEGLVILDSDGFELPQKSKLKFAYPFTTYEDGDEIVVSLFDEDADVSMFEHGNEAHTEAFATQEALQGHLDDAEPHGIDISQVHLQNTDTMLDEGGANEVSAAAIRAAVNATSVSVLLVTTEHETNVGDYNSYIADATSNHVKFVLPDAATYEGAEYTFRHISGTFAMNVERSGLDLVILDGFSWEGVTTDEPGTWFTLQSDGTSWYVTRDSGLTIANEI